MKIKMKPAAGHAVMLSLFVIVQALNIYPAFTQDVSRVRRVENNGQPSKIIPYSERFQFDKFYEGTVYLWGGGQSVALLNYNYLYNEIQFLNEKKDTLSILESDRVRFVSVAGRVYFHDKTHGYAEIIADTGDVKLGVKRGMALISHDKYIGHGQYTGLGAVGSMRSYINQDGKLTKLDMKTNLVLSDRTAYFFIDKNNRFFPAGEATCRKLFLRKSSDLKDYLKNVDVDFQNENDLRRLLVAAAGW